MYSKRKIQPKQCIKKIIENDLIFSNILNDYNLGLTYKELTEKYKISKVIINNTFLSKNIPIIKRRRKSILKPNTQIKTNPFQDLNNFEVLYWLGWLASDGSISGTRIGLGVQEKDIEVLENFIKFLNYPIKIKKIKKSINEKEFIGYRIAFRNFEIVNYLKQLGITERKSKTLKINFDLTFDFLRGFIEGDGYIDSKRNRIQISCASESMIYQIKNFLLENNITSSIYYSEKYKLYSFQVYKHSSVLQLIDKLYTNTHNIPLLKRKYDSAQQISNNLK